MPPFLAYLTPIRKTLFADQQPEAAWQALQPYLGSSASRNPQERRAVADLGGLILQAMGQYAQAESFYAERSDAYMAGYCAMLQGNLAAAQQHWETTLKTRENHWCGTLYGMITRQLVTAPTTFQIRNHLESDIANLIQAKQGHMLDNILVYAPILSVCNAESYKFIGRALMHAGWLERAKPYLLEAQKCLVGDPEIYFHLGQLTYHQRQFEDMRTVLNQCLLISPAYTPAQALMAKIPAAQR